MSDFNQAKYIQEYQKEKYDRCIFNVPKGQKNVIKSHYIKKGYDSLNAYVNDLIRKDMQEIKVADSIAIATLGLKDIDSVAVKVAVSPLGKLGGVKKKGIVADSALQSE